MPSDTRTVHQEGGNMGFNFENKIVMITGAGRGLGRHMALAFAEAGADLIIAARTEKEIEEAGKEIKALGREVMTRATDVSQYSEVDALVGEARERFGTIDVLVNNAGVVIAKPIHSLTEKDWDYTFDINIKGLFYTIKLVSEVMTEKRNGKIINISSLAGKVGYPLLSAYSASKFAVVGLTQSAASELAAYDIQVNAVCPGLMETGFSEDVFEDMSRYSALSPDEIKSSIMSRVPAGRGAELSEVCNTVMFLASEEAGYITGEAINLTGGLLTL
jgi:NAD(P)-dependent dehydrogenase (short-subunit alcohol dehydrogenase family)